MASSFCLKSATGLSGALNSLFSTNEQASEEVAHQAISTSVESAMALQALTAQTLLQPVNNLNGIWSAIAGARAKGNAPLE